MEVLEGVPYITGSLWERCQEVAADAADPDELLARCERFRGTRSVRLALDSLAQTGPTGTRADDLEATLEKLRRMHATWQALDEVDRADEVAAEIERVESLLGASRPK